MRKIKDIKINEHDYSKEYFMNRLIESVEIFGISNTVLIKSILESNIEHFVDIITPWIFDKMHEKIYCKCIDDTIEEGYVDSYIAMDWMNTKIKLGLTDNNEERDKRLLLKTDKAYAYCQQNQKFYKAVNKDVGLYLMRHKNSSFIYDIITGNTGMDWFIGPSISEIKKFLKLETNFRKKAPILYEDYVDEVDWLINYMNEQYIKEYKRQNIDRYRYKYADLRSLALEKDIIFNDLIVRIEDQGLSELQAMQIGLEEAEKYNLNCEIAKTTIDVKLDNGDILSLNPKNYNILAVLKVLAEE